MCEEEKHRNKTPKKIVTGFYTEYRVVPETCNMVKLFRIRINLIKTTTLKRRKIELSNEVLDTRA